MIVSSKASKKADIWDLRPNHQKSVKDFEFEKPIQAATFDQTGKYLLFSTSGDLHLIDAAKYSLMTSFKDTGNAFSQLK